MPSWIGPWEIAIVLILALLIFGPKKLPDLGSSLGRSITGFRKGLKESTEEVKSALKEDVTADTKTEATATKTEAAATKTEAAASETTVKTETTDQS
jgi:sec-independent protein translocase protein TatA